MKIEAGKWGVAVHQPNNNLGLVNTSGTLGDHGSCSRPGVAGNAPIVAGPPAGVLALAPGMLWGGGGVPQPSRQRRRLLARPRNSMGRQPPSATPTPCTRGQSRVGQFKSPRAQARGNDNDNNNDNNNNNFFFFF